MIVSILLILSLCLFHKAENATITPSFSGMTCPSNWAVGLTSLQIDITDPATAVTGTAEVTITYQTTTTKECVLEVQEAACAKKADSCTDMLFDTVTCTKANAGDPLAISFTTPVLTIGDHNAMISVTADDNFADYGDSQHALQVIYGPETLDSNSKTDSAVHEYNQEATFSCSDGFTGDAFTRILSACGEWTQRGGDADNGCTAITCTSSCTNCKYADGTDIGATLAYNDVKEVSCSEGFYGDSVIATCTIQGPIAVGITCTAITCTSSCTNCKYTDETAIDANLAYNDEKEVSCVEGFHGDPVDVTCTTQGEIAVGITCTAITCTISCDGCGYVDGSDIGTVLNYNDEKEVNCIAGTATPVSVTCTEQGSISVNIDCGTGSAGSFSSPWSTLIPVLLVYLIMDFLS